MKNAARILLVAPPGNFIPGKEKKHCVQPLGIAYIAACLERRGHSVKILDALAEGYNHEEPISASPLGAVQYGLTMDTIEDRIRAFQPDIVGVTCPQSTRHQAACDVLARVKKIDPKILTVIGGAHATATYRELAAYPEIDIVAVGEGEKTLEEISDQISRNSLVASSIPGIAFKRGSEVHETGPCSRYQNLDDIPYPAYHMLPMTLYSAVGLTPGSFFTQKKFSIMITSRGCPNACSYCPVDLTFGGQIRARSIENVIGEMRLLRDEFGIEEILFEDSNFSYDREHCLRLCAAIQNNVPSISWSCPHGLEVSRLDGALLKAMAESGCDTVYLAVETMSASKLPRYQPIKKVPDDKLREVIINSRANGLKVVCFFMLGFPGETLDDMDKTVQYAESLRADYVCFFCATPLPGTRFYDEALQKIILRPDFQYSMLRYSTGTLQTDDFTFRDVERRRVEGWKHIMWGNKT